MLKFVTGGRWWNCLVRCHGGVHFDLLGSSKKCDRRIRETLLCGTKHWKQTVYVLRKMCLYTSFKCDRDIHERIKKAPMGLPLSGFLAGAWMRPLENVLPKIYPKPSVRHLGDTFVIVKPLNLDQMPMTFSSIFEDKVHHNARQLALPDVRTRRNVNNAFETYNVQHTRTYQK